LTCSSIFAASQVDSERNQRPPSEATARELLELGAAQIEGRFADQPRVRARLELTIGKAYRDLGPGDPIGVIYLPGEPTEHVMYAVPHEWSKKQTFGVTRRLTGKQA